MSTHSRSEISNTANQRDALAERVLVLIDRLSSGGRDDSARDKLLVDIALWQARCVTPYQRLVQAHGVDLVAVQTPDDLPAIPTDVFRVARVAAHPSKSDVRTFLTSGTTSGTRGAACLRELTLYDRTARAAATRAMFPDALPRLLLVSLVPNERESPESSLAYMVARFHEWFGGADGCYVWKDGEIDFVQFRAVLDQAVQSDRPTCLLGTSFAFMFAEEGLGKRRWQLPKGSRIMQTGGFKGRTREVSPAEMRRMLSARYGVAEPWIIAEYGMTELSSQMYENTLAASIAGTDPEPRRLEPPPWVRVVITDPESLRPIEGSAPGLVRIEDPANVDTAWAIQTSDLGRRIGDNGFGLQGRATGATLRGCSLAVEDALNPADSDSVTRPAT